MVVEKDRIMTIAKLQKELTQTIKEISVTGKPVYILNDNNIEAVMIPFAEYEYLKKT